MSSTLHTRLVSAVLAALFLFAFAPVAFAEETEETDWESKATDKIELVEGLVADAEDLIADLEEDSDERAEADEDLTEVNEHLSAADAHVEDEAYEDAYDDAVDAYEAATELLNELKDEEEDDSDEDTEESDDDSDKRPAACKKDVRGNAHGLRAKCEGEHPADYNKERREARCDEAALDGERTRADYFCRAGEWREKREARLDDILDGLVEPSDVEDVEEIRTEIQTLIRQLIQLILSARLGN